MYIADTSGQFNLWKQQIAPTINSPSQITHFMDCTVRKAFASPTECATSVLIFADYQGTENYQIYNVDLFDGHVDAITKNPKIRYDWGQECFSNEIQQQIEWRRAKAMELLSKGENNQSEIARILQVDKSIVCRDIAYLRQQSKENIKRYIDERLPEEYEKCLVGLNAITKEAWNTAHNAEDKREKIQALSLAKECYSMKLDLLTNATVVDDAIRFVCSNKSKGHLKSFDANNGNEIDEEGSNEPDYDEDEDKLEEQQEEESGQITTNCVF